MPFGIPSEDFHGGFGLPRDADNVIDVRTKEQKRLDAIEQDDYDPYTGKYAFCSPSNNDLGFGENWVNESPEMPDEDREAAEAAQEAHDNLVRSLIEAGGEIRELNDNKKRLIFALKETVAWLDYFLTTNRDNIYYDEADEVRCRAEYLLMDLEG